MKLPTGKTLLGQHGEEDVVGHQPGHRDCSPAGPRLEDRIQALDVRNAGMREAQQVYAVEKGRDHPRAEQFDLAREQKVPDRMVLGA